SISFYTPPAASPPVDSSGGRSAAISQMSSIVSTNLIILYILAENEVDPSNEKHEMRGAVSNNLIFMSFNVASAGLSHFLYNSAIIT
ncbi:MAG: hypothetical protein EZS28_054452, partial [Streblomastix strix]